MSAPLPVTIVRPHNNGFVTLLGSIANLVVSALLVWWLAPKAFPWHPSYTHALDAVIVVRALMPTDTAWLSWTKAAATKKRATR